MNSSLERGEVADRAIKLGKAMPFCDRRVYFATSHLSRISDLLVNPERTRLGGGRVGKDQHFSALQVCGGAELCISLDLLS